jgi:hypothetical protein
MGWWKSGEEEEAEREREREESGRLVDFGWMIGQVKQCTLYEVVIGGGWAGTAGKQQANELHRAWASMDRLIIPLHCRRCAADARSLITSRIVGGHFSHYTWAPFTTPTIIATAKTHDECLSHYL